MYTMVYWALRGDFVCASWVVGASVSELGDRWVCVEVV